MKELARIIFALVLGLLALTPVAWADEVVWIDVRSAEEFAGGHVLPAINIPHDEIAEQISGLELALDQPIVLYCRSGRRSGLALETLAGLGYTQLTNAGSLEDAQKRFAESTPPGTDK